jgi:hypothetical protein
MICCGDGVGEDADGVTSGVSRTMSAVPFAGLLAPRRCAQLSTDGHDAVFAKLQEPINETSNSTARLMFEETRFRRWLGQGYWRVVCAARATANNCKGNNVMLSMVGEGDSVQTSSRGTYTIIECNNFQSSKPRCQREKVQLDGFQMGKLGEKNSRRAYKFWIVLL